MQTYIERSHQLAADASVAVLVLMGAPNDVEFIPMKPRAADDQMLAELKSRWPGRGLRHIGVVGLVGAAPRCVFKEPIEPEQVDALAEAFLAYLRVLSSPYSPPVDDSVEFCERLFRLPDTRRPN
jgi:hypothetical protein